MEIDDIVEKIIKTVDERSEDMSQYQAIEHAMEKYKLLILDKYNEGERELKRLKCKFLKND